MKLAPVIDLRSPAQVDRYWLTAWRLRMAANPRVRAVNAQLAEWHLQHGVEAVTKTNNVVSIFHRRQAS
jgi:hypothetical protein